MTGKRADQLVSGVNITANKNTVPFDPESPFVTSGLRLGSPAMTTRGMGSDEFVLIGDIIADRLHNPEDETVKQHCLDRVADHVPEQPHMLAVEALPLGPFRAEGLHDTDAGDGLAIVVASLTTHCSKTPCNP